MARFIQLTDIHLLGEGEVDRFIQKLLHCKEKFSPDAFLLTGDIVKSVPEQWEDLGERMAKLKRWVKTPVLHCPGNHDLISQGKVVGSFYRKHMGELEEVVKVAGVTVASLNVIGFPSAREIKKSSREVDAQRGYASPSRDKIKAVRQKAGRAPLIVLQHMQPCIEEMKLFDEFGVCAVLSGHWHATKVQQVGKCTSYNMPNPLFGGIDGSGAGFLLLDVNANSRVRARFHFFTSDGGSSDFQTALKVPKSKLNLRWKCELGASMENNQIAIDHELGRAYVSVFSRDTVRKNKTCAIDLRGGGVIWQRQTRQQIKRSLLLVGDSVIGAGYGGEVYAFSRQDGKTLWRYEVGNGIDRFLSLAPLLTKEGVFVGNAYSCAMLDPLTGEVRWRQGFNHEFASTVCQPLYCETRGLIVLPQLWFLHQHGKKQGMHPILDAKTGEVRWVHDKVKMDLSAHLTPALDGEIIYSSHNVKGIQASRVASDKLLWQLKVPKGKNSGNPFLSGSQSGTIAVTSSRVIFPIARGGVACCRKSDGKLLWSFDLEASRIYGVSYSTHPVAQVSSFHIEGKKLHFCAQDGAYYCLSLDSGKLLQRIALGVPSTTKPETYRKGLLLGDYSGRLSFFS